MQVQRPFVRRTELRCQMPIDLDERVCGKRLCEVCDPARAQHAMQLGQRLLHIEVMQNGKPHGRIERLIREIELLGREDLQRATRREPRSGDALLRVVDGLWGYVE